MQALKRILKYTCLVLVVILAIGTIGYIFWMRDRYVVPILTYHHVGIPSEKWRLNTVSEKSFDYQMSFIKRHGFQVISFGDLVEGIKKGYQFNRNTVVLQFDDGYEDNYKFAFPILKKYGFPAMVFVVSDKIGTPGFLTWDELKEMEKYSFLTGSHTRRHPYLPSLNKLQAEDEIAGSKKIIEDHLGHSIDYFAYPTGGFSSDIKRLVKESGYKAAVTTNRGKNRFNTSSYDLKRIHMSNVDDQYSLWFKLSGYYNLFRHAKRSGGLHQRSWYE